MYKHTFSKLANHQIRHQVTHKVDCQEMEMEMETFSMAINFMKQYYGRQNSKKKYSR